MLSMSAATRHLVGGCRGTRSAPRLPCPLSSRSFKSLSSGVNMVGLEEHSAWSDIAWLDLRLSLEHDMCSLKDATLMKDLLQ